MGQLWKTCVDFLIANRRELIIAAIFAILGAVIVTALGVDSAVRAGIRQVKNKLSERSVSRLRKRIVQLEKSRELYMAFASSDKALYLHTFQLVLSILMCGSLGATIFLFGLYMWVSTPTNPNPRDFFSLAILPFAFALGIGAWGIKIAALNTRA